MVDSTVSLAGNVSDHYFLGIMVRVCWQSNMSVFQSTALADRVVAKLSPINLIIQSGQPLISNCSEPLSSNPGCRPWDQNSQKGAPKTLTSIHAGARQACILESPSALTRALFLGPLRYLNTL